MTERKDIGHVSKKQKKVHFTMQKSTNYAIVAVDDKKIKTRK